MFSGAQKRSWWDSEMDGVDGVDEDKGRKNIRIDFVDNKVHKLQKCNVRRARKIKDMQRQIDDMQMQMEELRKRIGFLEAVMIDLENENEFFRKNQYSWKDGKDGEG